MSQASEIVSGAQGHRPVREVLRDELERTRLQLDDALRTVLQSRDQ
jgi:hypothetical protein